MRVWLCLVFVFCSTAVGLAEPSGIEPSLPTQMTVFLARDLETGKEMVLRPEELDQRHPPFSSFKIPNFLIALEEKAVASVQETIAYSPQRHPKQDWWAAEWAQDQTLDSAFRRSAAWAFQDLASRLDEATYHQYLEKFRYGNQAHHGDAFWLDRSLRISPREQVRFLEGLVKGEYKILPAHIEALKEAALQKEKSGLSLFGKTGAGPVRDNDFSGEFEGWFVGWLERPNAKPIVFALWTKGPNFEAIRAYRAAESQLYLRQLGYLPADW